MFKLTRNRQTLFQSGCTGLHSHQQRVCVPVALWSRQHLVVVRLLKFSHTGWYVPLVICIILMMSSNVSCAIGIPTSFVKYLFKPFAHFQWTCLSFHYRIIGVLCLFLYSLSPLSVICFLNIFSKSVACLLIFLMVSSYQIYQGII